MAFWIPEQGRYMTLREEREEMMRRNRAKMRDNPVCGYILTEGEPGVRFNPCGAEAIACTSGTLMPIHKTTVYGLCDKHLDEVVMKSPKPWQTWEYNGRQSQ